MISFSSQKLLRHSSLFISILSFHMPRISSKIKLQRELHNLFLVKFATATSSNQFDEAIDYLILTEDLKKQRYLASRLFVFKFNWSSSILSTLSKNRFRSFVRVHRFSLNQIADLIRDDFVFINNVKIAQTLVENQLKYTLYRLEHDDNVSGFLFTSILWRVSEKHVFDCIKRVIEALCRLKNRFVKWPNERNRTRESLINNKRQYEFIEVVDKVNGTDIALSIKSKDKYDDELFFNRKKRYALNLYAVCDFNKRINYSLTEWSNSQHDQRIFATDDLHKTSTTFFSEDQYVLEDSVYINSIYLMTLYKTSHIRDSEIRRFNRRLSRVRIDIEHTFDILKDRWKSLIGLRLRVRNKRSYIYAIRWITACVILHNILLNMKDDWNEDDEWWSAEEEAHDEELKQLNFKQLNEGTIKRNHVKELILSDDWFSLIDQNDKSQSHLSNSWEFWFISSHSFEFFWDVFCNSICSLIIFFSCCILIMTMSSSCFNKISLWCWSLCFISYLNCLITFLNFISCIFTKTSATDLVLNSRLMNL